MWFWEIGLQRFLFKLFWIGQAAKIVQCFVEKNLKIFQKFHGAVRKIWRCKKNIKFSDDSFTPMPNAIAHIPKETFTTFSLSCWGASQIILGVVLWLPWFDYLGVSPRWFKYVLIKVWSDICMWVTQWCLSTLGIKDETILECICYFNKRISVCCSKTPNSISHLLGTITTLCLNSDCWKLPAAQWLSCKW